MSTFSAIFTFKGSDPPEDVVLARMLKSLLRSYQFECEEIIEGNWRERATTPANPHQTNAQTPEASEAGNVASCALACGRDEKVTRS